ncbi:uncharacterized protein LOC115996031 [Ipomoea triloba]|uniref:uncharacterized protein LOC115996031 n=1 Tax=Ipomoea triloba TaxID=35885 RepID=UPI00125DFB62|nr:uncharacterized protein LOC115996031 [Ipomoea triloba]
MIEKVVVVCWAIWENRNDMVWNKQGKDPGSLVHHALLFVHAWQVAQDGFSAHNSAPMQHMHTVDWVPPQIHYLKINVDASMDFGNHCMSLGWVIRNEERVVQGVGMQKVQGLYTVREAEAMGVREVLSWIKRQGWRRVIVEADVQVVTKAVERGVNTTPFGALVYDIRTILKQLNSITLTFVPFRCNHPAHILARKSLFNPDYEPYVFFDSIPRCISGHFNLMS